MDPSVRLRDQTGGEQKTTNLELFFDLVYVFAVTQLSHLLLGELTWEGAAKTAFLLLVVWWAWVYTTWMANWFDPDWIGVRLVLIFCMLASLGMAIAIPEAFGDRALLFAGSYVALQVVRTGAAWRFWAPGSAQRRSFQRILIWTIAAGALWITGALLDGEARTVVWLAALLIDYAGPATRYWTPVLGRSALDDWQIEGGHFAERFQLFIIIALGESIVVTGATSAGLKLDAQTTAAVIVAFLGSAALWWLYFDEVAVRSQRFLRGRDDAGRLARNAYTYLHVPIVAGIIVSAVGDELLVTHPSEPLSPAGVCCVVGGTVIYLLGHQGFRYTMIGNISRKRSIAIAVLIIWGVAAQNLDALIVAAGVVVILVALVLSETRHRLSTDQKLH